MAEQNQKFLKILFLAAEAAPLVKIGGLADVAGALPAELRRRGHDVRLVLPLHPALRARAAGWKPAVRPAVPARGSAMQADVYQMELDGVPLYLVDGPPLRASESVYHSDSGRDAPKYVFFSLASLELARALDWKPDLVHANDWHTAAANLWLAGRGRQDRFFTDVGSVLSIHNLPYLGHNAGWALAQFGLGVPPPAPPAARGAAEPDAEDRFGALPDWAYSALLPLGIAAADMIVAVSRSYAEEILTPEFGAGLEDYLRAQRGRLTGIRNGIDTDLWNPAADPRLAERFDSGSLERRAANKTALQQKMGLDPEPAVPLIGIVSRLNEQKGIDLALSALECWCGRGNQAVILGAGDPRLEQQCRTFAARHRGRAAMEAGHHEDLAAWIYGGSDFFMIPSRYEPCGVTQMIAMRYGSLPVVRAVGGLKDTVLDLSHAEGTGLVFAEASAAAAGLALGRAEELFRQRERCAAARARGMAMDFSWSRSVEEYLTVYRRVLEQ
ncbi:MAG: glycogen synthase [Anaerolineales bacterium]|nr:glycogen synthase [Anaerolineales bacterium]